MKRKYVLLLLLLVALFTFTGCSNNNKTKLVENKDYYVKGEFTGKYLDIKKRGYYIDSLDEPNAPYYYIICMGEKNTGGYSLKIKEVNRDNNKTEIIVEEIEPGKNETVTMAFTTPTVCLELSKKPNSIKIINTEGKIYEKLN